MKKMRRRPAHVEPRTAEQIKIMREAGRLVALVHSEVQKAIKPGVTTADLDVLAEQVIRENGAIPSFKGYHGFPASICASINNELVHGIPSPKRVLKEGDIISVDTGTIYKGWQGDGAWTYPVGEISEEAQRLLAVTRDALYAGIGAVKAGKPLMQVSAAIQQYVESHGLSVVREYTGHGIGRNMHEPPEILHYVNMAHPDSYLILQSGMTFALEPMVNVGGWETRVLSDGWTVVTGDDSLSAHFEHTLLVTESGAEILTRL